MEGRIQARCRAAKGQSLHQGGTCASHASILYWIQDVCNSPVKAHGSYQGWDGPSEIISQEWRSKNAKNCREVLPLKVFQLGWEIIERVALHNFMVEGAGHCAVLKLCGPNHSMPEPFPSLLPAGFRQNHSRPPLWSMSTGHIISVALIMWE